MVSLTPAGKEIRLKTKWLDDTSSSPPAAGGLFTATLAIRAARDQFGPPVAAGGAQVNVVIHRGTFEP